LKDLLFGQGYAFAQDRTFQLEFYRSLINGELSLLFGADLVETDKVLRTVGLKRAAESMESKLTEEQLDLVTAYVRGVNTYYEQHPHNVPFELAILGATPKAWERTDVIAMGSIVAFTFAFGGLNDEVNFLKLMNQVGISEALELKPVDFQPAHDYISNLTEFYYPDEEGLALSGDIADKITVFEALDPIFGPHMEVLEGYMSNNWIVSADKSATGKPLLANDPHTSLEAQGIWHRTNLMSRDGEILLQGFNFPGTPLMGFGHNKAISWGVTSGIMDAVDAYFLTSNDTHYLYNGDEWREFETQTYTIEISGGETVEHTAKFSEFGPMMMTDLGEFAMQWTLLENFERDNPIKSLIDFNQATSIDEFHEALEFMLTGFNWVAVDSTTNDIAYIQSGLIPDRKEGYGLIPKNGSAPNQGWNGLVPFDQQLYVVNPTSGYAPRHRDDRIEQVLESCIDFDCDPDALTVDDMKRLQADVKTLVAEDILDPVLDLFSDYKNDATELEKRVIDELLGWDQHLTVDSVAGLIFSSYRLLLIDEILRDELGDLVTVPAGTRITTDWYREGMEMRWFDDITTDDKVEDSDDIAIRTLQRTTAFLEDRYGDDFANWEYGDKHRTSLPHTFSGLTGLFDIGGVPQPGSSNTVNAIAGPRFNNADLDFRSSYGPYFRVVFEVEPTWDNIWVMVSSGASGNPLSEHYGDAFEKWAAHEYFKWESSLETITSYRLSVEVRKI
ncbi:MAG: penicillin acylase family protein, partial [Candidatus Kariarchaeaceae archaeon]